MFPILVTFFGLGVHYPQETAYLRLKNVFNNEDFPLEILPIKT
jgi:hypothetical protein